jgi:hypothetical protein
MVWAPGVIAESGIVDLGNVTSCCSNSSLLIHEMHLLLPF